MEKNSRSPGSLLAPEATGGDIAEGGFAFQDNVVVARRVAPPDFLLDLPPDAGSPPHYGIEPLSVRPFGRFRLSAPFSFPPLGLDAFPLPANCRCARLQFSDRTKVGGGN